MVFIEILTFGFFVSHIVIMYFIAFVKCKLDLVKAKMLYVIHFNKQKRVFIVHFFFTKIGISFVGTRGLISP